MIKRWDITVDHALKKACSTAMVGPLSVQVALQLATVLSQEQTVFILLIIPFSVSVLLSWVEYGGGGQASWAGLDTEAIWRNPNLTALMKPLGGCYAAREETSRNSKNS